MKNDFTPMQYILLVLLLPPVGAFFVCRRSAAPFWCKLAAVGYCVAVLLLLLLIRAPVGTVSIDARPIPYS